MIAFPAPSRPFPESTPSLQDWVCTARLKAKRSSQFVGCDTRHTDQPVPRQLAKRFHELRSYRFDDRVGMARCRLCRELEGVVLVGIVCPLVGCLHGNTRDHGSGKSDKGQQLEDEHVGGPECDSLHTCGTSGFRGCCFIPSCRLCREGSKSEEHSSLVDRTLDTQATDF